jgi:hypothetical protein
MTTKKETKSQVERFREAAREVGADGSEAELDRYIKQVAKGAPKEEKPKKALPKRKHPKRNGHQDR